MAQPTLIPNCDGARFESLPLDTSRNRCILALDLGTTTGWAIRGHDGLITSGTVSLRPGRFDGGGMRYLRFTNWLTEIDRLSGPVAAIWFEEVRRHAGTDASHIYGGLMASLTAWAELRGVPYEGVPVGTIKRHAAGKGNADKAAMVAAKKALDAKPKPFPTMRAELEALKSSQSELESAKEELQVEHWRLEVAHKNLQNKLRDLEAACEQRRPPKWCNGA